MNSMNELSDYYGVQALVGKVVDKVYFSQMFDNSE